MPFSVMSTGMILGIRRSRHHSNPRLKILRTHQTLILNLPASHLCLHRCNLVGSPFPPFPITCKGVSNVFMTDKCSQSSRKQCKKNSAASRTRLTSYNNPLPHRIDGRCCRPGWARLGKSAQINSRGHFFGDMDGKDVMTNDEIHG